MGVHYLGLVSRHNLVCPFIVMVPCPRLGPFMFCHDGGRFATTVAVGVLLDTGPPRTSPVGSESKWSGDNPQV